MTNDQIKAKPDLIAGLALSIAAAGIVLWTPTSPLRFAAALALLCFLPGWALVEAIFVGQENKPNLIERLLLGVGMSYVLTIVGGLWIYYALGSLSLNALLGVYLSAGLFGFGFALYQGHKSGENQPTSPPLGRGAVSSSGIDAERFPHQGGLGRRYWLPVLALILLAAVFRFYFLSYSDYRGDEAEVVMRAIAAIRGQGEPILSHTKGPAETLLAAATGLLYGAFDELAIRVPFALANLLAVAALYLLGERLFGRRTALIGVALAAINGWYITYGRTAQYQNLVLPMLTLGMWGYVRFYQNRVHRYHFLGTLFIALATLAHYEGASAAPAALYLLVLGLKDKFKAHPGANLRQILWPAAVSLLVGGIVTASFYIPFLISPTVSGAQSHVSKRFGSTPPYNNWDLFYVNALFYSAMYYVLAMGVALLGGTLRGIRQALGGGRRGLWIAAAALPFLLLSWTGLLPAWYAVAVYLLLMGLFLFSPRISVAVKSMLLWILLPVGVYVFAVIRPGNHYYVFAPPLILLAALAIDRALTRLRQLRPAARRWALPAAAAILIALYGLSAWYEQLVFLQTDKEYMLTYPENKNPIFISDSRFPFKIRIGWGFPYRLGWQTVGQLYRSGQLAGDWYSTDAGNSPTWYTLGSPQNPCFPRYYMLTEIGYEDPPLDVPLDIIEAYYSEAATVNVNDKPRLRLYEFDPEGDAPPPVVYEEPADYATLYQTGMYLGDQNGPVFHPAVAFDQPPRFKPHPNMLAELSDVYNDPNTVLFQEEVSLLGYDLDLSRAKPGGVVMLTLYWQADSPVFLPYKVFTHLENEQTWAQADDEPGCSNFPTYTWRAGDQIMDRHAIFLPDDIPPGEYPLQVGLYEVRTGMRMDLLDEAGNPAGNSLVLPPVLIP